MSIEQTLSKLQNIIHETLPNLELFVDGNVQPGSHDCENLQKQLNSLQEHLSVYKHLKTNKEISPSFGLHAKINQVVAQQEIESEKIVQEIKEETNHTPHIDPIKITASANGQGKKMEIALNQKFQFINDLFSQNTTEYSTAIDQLNNCANWEDAETYLNGLKSVYNWKDANENYKAIKELAKKRFS
ncbi:MAG: hypothetical protein JNM96_03060 [Bacteroidia bacterium]|nr:hypothetical protein [Bacteroidia bacterium]